MEELIVRFRNNGRIRTSETYHSTLRSFSKFRGCRDIDFRHIDTTLIEAYEAWLRSRGLVPNTTSFYMRILRAVYHRAVDLEYTENHRPFRHVYTGVDRTVKRALPLSALRRIRSLDLSGKSALDYARDMFLLSFYLRGMSFIDMAYLRKTDLRGSHIIYRRRKTGQCLTIAWTREMQTILDKYPRNSSEFLLPIIRHQCRTPRNVYRNVGYTINYNLKRIAAMVGITTPLTLYVARHSWASIAQSKGIPVSVISEGMGHDSEQTTRIYLSGLSTSAVDRANARILKAL